MSERVTRTSLLPVSTAWIIPTLLLAAGLLAQSPPPPLPLSWENIIQQRDGVSQAELSPDGRWVAVRGQHEGNAQIYRINTTSGEIQPWLQGGNPQWSPDGGSLLYSRERDLWLWESESGSSRRITHDREDERDARFSPDGRQIAFYSTRSGSQDIWIVSSSGDAPPLQLTEAAMTLDDGRFAPAWSPDGKQIAYISNQSDYWHDDVWVVDVSSRRKSQLSRGLMASSTPVWSPDGSRIALLGTDKSEYWYEDLAYIYLLDPVAGSEWKLQMQVYATDWLHSLGLYWSGDGSRIYFFYLQEGDFDLWSVPSAGGVATQVTYMGGAIRGFSASRDADSFVFVRNTPRRGSEVDYLPSAGGPIRQLTHFSRDWQGLVDPVKIAYRSFDGLYVQGYLFQPPGWDSGQRFPALVNVHGGGTNSYLNGQQLTEQYLASRGYLVLAVNYRGGSGFGREFQNLSVRDWANGQARDAAAAAGFLRRLSACNGKVGIYGYSYGGIQSMAAIARVPDAFDAAVPMAGIYDFGDAYLNADRLGRIFIRTGHGGSPDERPEIYAISNTLARLSQVRTPLLIMHGEADVRAPFRQYQKAVAELKRSGKDFESKSYPGEPHGFRNPQNRIDLYQRLEAFFHRHLVEKAGPGSSAGPAVSGPGQP